MPISNSTDRFNGVVASLAIKVRCVVATTANVPLLSGNQIIEGVPVVAGDRVLLAAQTDPIENGVYDVQDPTAWTRAADWDGNRDVELGSTVWAGRLAGSDVLYQVTAPAGVILPGSTAVTVGLLLDPDAAGGASSLQAVTDVGNVTNNGIILTGNGVSAGSITQYDALTSDQVQLFLDGTDYNIQVVSGVVDFDIGLNATGLMNFHRPVTTAFGLTDRVYGNFGDLTPNSAGILGSADADHVLAVNSADAGDQTGFHAQVSFGANFYRAFFGVHDGEGWGLSAWGVSNLPEFIIESNGESILEATFNGSTRLYGNNTLMITAESAAARIEGPISMIEVNLPGADVLTRGQFWVRDDNPNVPMFRDDLGTDFQLNLSAASNLQDTLDAGNESNTGIILQGAPIQWEDDGAVARTFLLLVAGGVGDPDWADVELLAEFDGTNGSTVYQEVSTNAQSATFVGNAALDTTNFLFGTASVALDGAGDYVTFPDNAGFHVNNNDFQIEGFIRFNSLPIAGEEYCIASQWLEGTAADEAFALTIIHNAGSLRIRGYNDGGFEQGSLGIVPTLGVWYHIAMTGRFNGGLGDLGLYFNGSERFYTSFAIAYPITNSTETLKIGAMSPSVGGSEGYFDGNIDEVRFTNGTARIANNPTYTIPSAAFPIGSGSPEVYQVGFSGIDTQFLSETLFDRPLTLAELAAPSAFTAGRGQFWVRSDAPNTPMFTDDLGTDFVLNAGGAPVPPIVLLDTEEIQFGTGGDITMQFDGTNFLVESIAGFPEFQLRDGIELKIFDQTNAHFIELRSNGTNANFSVSSGQINVLSDFSLTDNTEINFGSSDHLRIFSNGTNAEMVGLANGVLLISGFDQVRVPVLGQNQSAAPDGNVADVGQWWTRSAAPCRPMYTDDTDVDQEMDPSRSDLNEQNGNYTFLITDKGKTIYKASGGAGETYTIPASGAVAYQIGTWIAIDNDGGGDLTIAITTDTLVGTDGATGSRTLGDNHRALVQKIGATRWRYQASDL